MTPEEVVEIFKELHNAADIRANAEEDEETPFGYVLEWLRDYGIPKTQGYPYAEQILADYGIK